MSENVMKLIQCHAHVMTANIVPCVFLQFVFLTYILGVAWLGVFGFSAVPVFLFYNMWSTCATMRSPMANLTNIDNICVDVRQYGRKTELCAKKCLLLVLRTD